MQVRFASNNGTLVAKSVSGESIDDVEGSLVPIAEATPNVTDAPDATATPGLVVIAEVEGPKNFVCILEGPGRSVVLGYADEQMAVSKSTPATICTTERGCLEIAAAKFSVKEAVHRSYCDHSKNVVVADEATLQRLISR